MAETNVLAMRLGPGKHLHDRKILGGDVMDGREFGMCYLSMKGTFNCHNYANIVRSMPHPHTTMEFSGSSASVVFSLEATDALIILHPP